MLRTVNLLRNPCDRDPLAPSLPPTPTALVTTAPLRWLNLSILSPSARIWWAATALVVFPVFVEAPLVRTLPWLGLTLMGGWLMAGLALMSRQATRLWGDLCIGFAWTWGAGALYWGWFRWEPLVHIPLEALPLPIVVYLLSRGWGRVGCYFYLGSLLGTAVTDLYINTQNLLPFWRQVMVVPPDQAPLLLGQAIAHLQTPTAAAQAAFLALGLFTLGMIPFRSSQPCWWAFSGAVLSTLLVDSLFAVAAWLG